MTKWDHSMFSWHYIFVFLQFDLACLTDTSWISILVDSAQGPFWMLSYPQVGATIYLIYLFQMFGKTSKNARRNSIGRKGHPPHVFSFSIIVHECQLKKWVLVSPWSRTLLGKNEVFIVIIFVIIIGTEPLSSTRTS